MLARGSARGRDRSSFSARNLLRNLLALLLFTRMAADTHSPARRDSLAAMLARGSARRRDRSDFSARNLLRNLLALVLFTRTAAETHPPARRDSLAAMLARGSSRSCDRSNHAATAQTSSTPFEICQYSNSIGA
jgi:Arc/MetJ-type ribon-helix-helix transcriptional regulator